MKIAVIADDLTGSNVDGALLRAEGFSSATCLDSSDWDEEAFAGVEAIAVSTDSRLLSPEEAREKVRKAVSMLASKQPVLFAKRIDSTLRGNLGAEIETALEAIDEENRKRAIALGQMQESVNLSLAVVVPAYPESGRIAAGGYLLVHGMALQCSPIAKDPANPLSSSSIAAIIASQTDLPIAGIGLDSVLAGTECVRGKICDIYAQGYRIAVCDAVSDADIATIAGALHATDFPVLAVDPGPFTAKLASVRVSSSRVACNNRVLAIIGSASELTRKQVQALFLAHDTHFVKVDSAKLLDSTLREAEIERAVDTIGNAPETASVVGVHTVAHKEDVLPLLELAEKLGVSTGDVSQAINTALAEIAKKALSLPQLRIGGLYTSGGEITVSVIRTIGGKGFSVRDEVLPLAVYGHVIKGEYPGLRMVTKGGFVGDAKGLVQCIDYLLTKISTQTRT